MQRREGHMTHWASYLEWRPAFVAAMDERLHTGEWLDMRLLSGSVQFWRSARAAAITEIRFYPTGAYDVHGLVAAGDAREVRDRIIPQIEAWGRAIGALGIVIESRPGWARILRGTGFESYQLATRKELMP
jgi:hypothetical protein